MTDPRPSSAVWRVGAISTAIATLLVTLMLVQGREPIELMLPGELTASAPLVAEHFGEDVLLEDDLGYDGQQFWALAVTFPDLDEGAQYVDNAQYRLQRIVTPALASPFGDGNGPAAAILVLGIVGVFLGSVGLADLSERHGRPAWLGYCFGPPLLVAVLFGLSEPFAYGVAFAGLALVDRERVWLGTAVLVVAALARESVAVMVGAVFLACAISGRWRWPLLLVPAVAGSWMLYLRSEYPDAPSDERFDLLGLLSGSGSTLLGAAVLLALVVVAVVRWRDVAVLWPCAAVFGVLALAYSPSLFRYQVFWRANTPAIALGLAAVAHWYAERRSVTPPRSPGAAPQTHRRPAS